MKRWYLLLPALLVFAVGATVFFLWRAPSTQDTESLHVWDLQLTMITLTEYLSFLDRFPPPVVTDEAGKPLYSWRGTVFAWLHAYGLEERVAEDNGAALDELAYYAYPQFCWERDGFGQLKTDTNVLAVTGPGTFFSLESPQPPEDFVWDSIVLVQTAQSGVHWLRPGDLDVGNLPPSLTAGIGDAGMFVVFLDGEIWLLSKDVPQHLLIKLFTLEGARKNDRDSLLGPYVLRKYLEGCRDLLWDRKIHVYHGPRSRSKTVLEMEAEGED